MLGPIGYTTWLVAFLADVYVVVYALARREFARYLSLNLYVLSLVSMEVARFLVFRAYGRGSPQYFHTYYYTDAVVTVMMYLAVIGLYLHVFDDMHLSKYIRGLAVVVLSATACFAFLVVERNSGSLTESFVVELGQNLYFIGVAMTYILWVAMLKLRVTRLRTLQIVSAFGLFFTIQAATYGLRMLFPTLLIWRVILPLVGMWLPLSLAFTFSRVPEEARVATARVAGGAAPGPEELQLASPQVISQADGNQVRT